MAVTHGSQAGRSWRSTSAAAATAPRGRSPERRAGRAQHLYLDNELLHPVRRRYCRQRLPDLGKYSWRIVREEFQEMANTLCDGEYDAEFTFQTLQESGLYDV